MNFLNDDQEQAKKEIDCYNYCMTNVVNQLQKEEYGKASAYLNNANRSLQALEKMKTAKQTFDQAWWEIKQIEGQQEVDRVIANMRLGL